MYDFCMLPLALKAHLPKEDENALSEIPTRWKAGIKIQIISMICAEQIYVFTSELIIPLTYCRSFY